ncbi:hypothetical protein RBB78_09865 [Tunturiibacter empetritectus]|uniref:hypothetical protein n=1 Tax=Tunturiibacter empetritectus TaxID=3069691 RepID=UPI003D9B40B0
MGALTGLLAVGAPDAAEGAVLGAATDGLNGGPHVLVAGHEIPAGGEEVGAADAAAFVDLFGLSAGEDVGDGFAPGYVAVAFDYGVGFAALECFFGEEGGVDAAVDDPGSAFAGDAADLVAAEGVAGVDADADDVAGLDGVGDDLFDGFVDEDGVACEGGCGGGEDEEPTGCDYSGPKRVVAGIYEMNTQESNLARYGGFTECLRLERINAELRLGGECWPGRFPPD